MTTIGYHCSHEQHAPGVLLEHATGAERAGARAAMCSDHFAPWSEDQGQSGFAWSWLGAALQATSMTFGTVSAPGQRYHPAILAQAIATLGSMFPDRFWVALGTGEALNEHITGAAWPSRHERRARLAECVDVMRALLRGEQVTHRGHVDVHEAQLYTRPERTPPLFGAAISEGTARWVGTWADGMITVAQPEEQLRRVIDAFRAGGGTKPVAVQVPLCLAASDDEAEHLAWQTWRTNVVGTSDTKADLTQPQHFDAAAAFVRPSDVRDAIWIASSVDALVDRLGRTVAAGADRIYLHAVGAPTEFIERALPRILRSF